MTLTSYVFISASNPLVGKLGISTTAPVIAVHRGQSGFYPITTTRSADELNRMSLNDEQTMSALAASMFGWHTPAAKDICNWLDIRNSEVAK
jgi:cation transport regulator ChaC